MATAYLNISVKECYLLGVTQGVVDTEDVNTLVADLWTEVLDESVTKTIDLGIYFNPAYPLVVRKSEITGIAAYFAS